MSIAPSTAVGSIIYPSRDVYPRGDSDFLAQGSTHPLAKAQTPSRLLPSNFLSPRRSLPAATALAKPLKVKARTVLWCGWLHWRTEADTYERRYGVVDVARQELHLYVSARNQEPCFHEGDLNGLSARNAGFVLPTANTVSLDLSDVSRAECIPLEDRSRYVAVLYALVLEGSFSSNSTGSDGRSFSDSFSKRNFSTSSFSSHGSDILDSGSIHGKKSDVALFATAAAAAACQAAILSVAGLPEHGSSVPSEVSAYGTRSSSSAPVCRVPQGAVRWQGWIQVEPASSTSSGTIGNMETTSVTEKASVEISGPLSALSLSPRRYAILVTSMSGSTTGPALLLCETPPMLSEPVTNPSTTKGASRASAKSISAGVGAGISSSGHGFPTSRAPASSLTAEVLELLIPADVVANALPLGKTSTAIVFERSASQSTGGLLLAEASGAPSKSDEEMEDENGEFVSLRIAIKINDCDGTRSAPATSMSSGSLTEVFDIRVLPRPPLPPNLTSRPSNLKLSPLSTALSEESSDGKKRFLNTEEMRQRSEAAAVISTELKGDGSAISFRRAVVAVRTEAACAWRKLASTSAVEHSSSSSISSSSFSSSSSSGSSGTSGNTGGLLVSASTGHRSLWRPASLSAELAECHEAASNAAQRLAALPPSAYEVTPMEKSSKTISDNSSCYLLVASDCIQRLDIQAYASESANAAKLPSVGKASRRSSLIGASLIRKRRDNTSDEKVKEEGSNNDDMEEYDTFDDDNGDIDSSNHFEDGVENVAVQLVAQAAFVRVHRMIPLRDMQRAWTDGGNRTNSSDDGNGSSGIDTSVSNRGLPHNRLKVILKRQPSDELYVGIECVVPVRGRQACSNSVGAFGWRKAGATARTSLVTAFSTSAHGSVSGGAKSTGGDSISNSSHGNSSSNTKDNRFLSQKAPLMRKRTFYFITPNVDELEADLNVRLDMSKLLQNFGNSRRIATRAAGRAATKALPFSASALAKGAGDHVGSEKSRSNGEAGKGSGDKEASTETATWAEAKAVDLRERFASALTFLYGPTDSNGNYHHSSSDGTSSTTTANGNHDELVVSDAVKDAIESFSVRAGDSLLQELPGFLADFVDYVVDRFWVLAGEANEDGTSTHGSSSSNHGEEGRGSSLTKSLGLTAQEAEALKVQLHQLLVDTLVLPLLGDALWAQCLQTCQQQDDAFQEGVRAHRAFEAAAAAVPRKVCGPITESVADPAVAVVPPPGSAVLPLPPPPPDTVSTEGGAAAGLLAGRNVDWPAAAAALRRVERTLNPSDQLEAVRKSVAVLTTAQSIPTVPSEDPSSTNSKAAAASAAAADAPLSADDLIPAFIEVVARAAATSSANTNDLLVPPNNSRIGSSSNSSSGSSEDLLAFGLLSPASVVEWLRALVHPELLMMEPGFVLALLEGAVAFLADGGASAATRSTTFESVSEKQHQTSEVSSDAAAAAAAALAQESSSAHVSVSSEAKEGNNSPISDAAGSSVVEASKTATSSPEAGPMDTAALSRHSSLSWRLSTPLSASSSQRPSPAVVAMERSMEQSLRRSASMHWSSSARLRATTGGPTPQGDGDDDGAPPAANAAAPASIGARGPPSARAPEALSGRSLPPRVLTWSPQALREAVAEVQAQTAGGGAACGAAAEEANSSWRHEGSFGRTPEILRLSHAPAYALGEALSTVRDSGGSGSSDDDEEEVQAYSSHALDESASH